MDKLLTKVEKGFAGFAVEARVKDAALVNLEHWLKSDSLTDYRPYLDHLIMKDDFVRLLDSFWRMIPFGTGGRRGPVGAGPNRINPRTIALSVQGHCQYLREVIGVQGEIAVVVAYDVRQFFDLRGVYPGVEGLLSGLTSRDLARFSAMTYAANGVTAYVVGPLEEEDGVPICTDRYISTPELSFLIRELGAAGGLNISASHNHPDDNGGKFYNRHGGQEIPPDDETLLKIVEKVVQVETMPYAAARTDGLIRLVPPELHEQYIQVNTALCPTASRSAKVAFSPLCGTGNTTAKEALLSLGFQVVPVPEQSLYDGSFASVRYRIGNPEVPDSMDRLADVGRQNRCDLGFATDPDADRLGLIVPDDNWEFQFVGGNEIGVILLQSILSAAKRRHTLPKRPIFINTLVTSTLQREIATRHGCQVIGDLMVGFKYMGDVLHYLDTNGRFPPADSIGERDSASGTLDDFVFACEESHGYLLTHRVRDKDACGAAVHLAGLASMLKDEGSNFGQLLRNIWRVYGYYRNQLRSLVMEGIVGLERIARIQERLRHSPPTEIGGMAVVRFVDFQKVGGSLRSGTDEASRNVLLFELDAGLSQHVRLVIRPSGTEPKTKIYVEIPPETSLGGTLDQATADELARVSDAELDRLISQANALAEQVGNQFIRYCLGPEVLGDVYPEVPPESLLVSDLVPVDSKIRLCTELLPGLLSQLTAGRPAAEIDSWLDQSLRPFGEDPRGLIRTAARVWLERALERGRATQSTIEKAHRHLQLDP